MRVALIRGSLIGPWEFGNHVVDGVDVELMAARGGAEGLAPPFAVRELRSPAQVLSRLSPRATGLLELVAGSIQYLSGLEEALDGFDVAHATEVYMPMTLQACDARDRGRCRVVVASVMENRAFQPDHNRFERRRIDRIARRVDHFVAMSEAARLHLELYGVEPERITVRPNGIDTERFRPAPGPAEHQGLRVLSVSRLEYGKGVEDLVIAIGLLARRGVDARVTLQGRGPLERRLRQIAAAMGVTERVTFGGFVPYPGLPEVYRAHDVFVLASGATRYWQEQLGYAVLEAMASGLPVIAGASGSLPEVVGRDDALVRPHDPEALADALEALTDPSVRADRGAFSRRRALERYDQRDAAADLRDLYARLLKDARTP